MERVNRNKKLTEQQKAAIIALHQTGISVRHISEEYNISVR